MVEVPGILEVPYSVVILSLSPYVAIAVNVVYVSSKDASLNRLYLWQPTFRTSTSI